MKTEINKNRVTPGNKEVEGGWLWGGGKPDVLTYALFDTSGFAPTKL